MNKKIAILYHKGCSDGFAGAWAFWKKFKDKAVYWPMEYQVPPPSFLENIEELYLVDFSFPEEVMKALSKKIKIIVIDHHKTQEKAVEFSEKAVFDLNHSGAVLTWNYLYPKNKIPSLLLRIEDIDLWRFKIKDTKKAIANLESYPKEFKLWDKLIRDFDNPLKRKIFLKDGEAILRYQNQMVEQLVESAVKTTINDKTALVVNSPVQASEIGNRLSKDKAEVGIIWSHKDGKTFVSLRSTGDVDVSEIAKHYGGGGHKNAAGFSIKTKNNEFPWKTN